ncbi:VOC family protein [Methylomusa anaerophila]|uniref:Glyoxalase-like domain protein n=1 Tax=Methylomusa anaerophila TaxID=1930071 RepID=A0A348AQZ7_9FIRM|nr:VOC family protein [Methylomusa anaerophila]BBB93495.1 glyoxalase-like domain protein [Methylomusa anaerophila]
MNLIENNKVYGIHHIAIRAKDFEKTVRFYIEVLDFNIRHIWSLPEFNLKQAAMLKSRDGSSFIEIFDNDADIAAEGRRPLAGEEPVQGSLLHFSVLVDNAELAYSRALSAGASPCVPPMTLFLGDPPLAVRNALVYSPNGEVIEFMESNNL